MTDNQVQALRAELRSDLRAIWRELKDAREAHHATAQAVARLEERVSMRVADTKTPALIGAGAGAGAGAALPLILDLLRSLFG